MTSKHQQNADRRCFGAQTRGTEMMKTWYVVLENNYCTLVQATTARTAMHKVNTEFSKEERYYQGCEAKSARIATAEDQSWCTSMGSPITIQG